jgi:hypothetical protein
MRMHVTCVRADLARRAGLTALVKLSESKKEFIRKKATTAIDALYLTGANTVGVEVAGVSALIKLAHSKKPDTQCTALWSLVTILGIAFSGDDDTTQVIRAHTRCCCVCVCVCALTSVQRRIVDEGGLKCGMALLESDHHEVRHAIFVTTQGQSTLRT